GVVLLDLGDSLLLRRHRDLIVGDGYLLVANGFVLLREIAVQPPVLFAALITGELAEDRSKTSSDVLAATAGSSYCGRYTLRSQTRATGGESGSHHTDPCGPQTEFLPKTGPSFNQIVEVIELNFRAAFLQRRQTDTVVSLLHPQVVQAHSLASQF